MNKLRKFFNWLLLPPAFYELQTEWDELKDQPTSQQKYFKLSDLCKRYSNGYAICMSYGDKDQEEYHNHLANIYLKLYKIYREKGLKYE
jgi:hypothetical protein